MNIYEGIALPKYSTENRLLDLQFELKISSACLARLGGISQSALSNAFRGVKSLPNEVGHELLQTALSLMQVVEASRPWTVPLSDPRETLEFIHRLQKAGVTPANIREGISRILGDQQ